MRVGLLGEVCGLVWVGCECGCGCGVRGRKKLVELSSVKLVREDAGGERERERFVCVSVRVCV